MVQFLQALALFILAAGSAVAQERQQPDYYLELCLTAKSPGAFIDTLDEMNEWSEVELNPSEANYDWSAFEQSSPEKFVLFANFSLLKVRQNSTRQSVFSSRRFFEDELAFNQQLLPFYSSNHRLFLTHPKCL